MSGRGKMKPPPDPDDPRRRYDPGAGLRAHVEAAGVHTQPPRPDPAAEAAEDDSGRVLRVDDVQITDVDGRPIEAWTSHDQGDGSGISHIEPQQILDVFGVTQEEVDSVAPPAGMEQAARDERDAVFEQIGRNAERLNRVLARATETSGGRALALADMRIFVTNLIEERNNTHHRPGTGPHYRQEGEVTALGLVLDYIDNPPRAEQRGQPSITCPDCGRTSYNPNDIEQRYCSEQSEQPDPPWAGLHEGQEQT